MVIIDPSLKAAEIAAHKVFTDLRQNIYGEPLDITAIVVDSMMRNMRYTQSVINNDPDIAINKAAVDEVYALLLAWTAWIRVYDSINKP